MEPTEIVKHTSSLVIGVLTSNPGGIASGAVGIFKAVKDFFSKDSSKEEVIEDLEKNPDDEDLQATFRVALKKALQDEEFKKMLETEFQKLQDETGQTIPNIVKKINKAENVTVQGGIFVQGDSNVIKK